LEVAAIHFNGLSRVEIDAAHPSDAALHAIRASTPGETGGFDVTGGGI
jgi:hypothetical protein